MVKINITLYPIITPYENIKAKYEVTSVYTLLSATEAEKQGWDPMIFLMKSLDSGEVIVWLYYWTKNRHGEWSNGQFPLLLTIDHLKSAIKKFGIE